MKTSPFYVCFLRYSHIVDVPVMSLSRHELQIVMHLTHRGAYLSDTYTHLHPQHLHHHYFRLFHVYHWPLLCHVIVHESLEYLQFSLLMLYFCHAPSIISLLSLQETLLDTFWCCYEGRYALNGT